MTSEGYSTLLGIALSGVVLGGLIFGVVAVLRYFEESVLGRAGRCSQCRRGEEVEG